MKNSLLSIKALFTGLWTKVTFTHDIPNENYKIYGEFNEVDEEIICCKDQTDERIHITLLHEVIHSILYFSGHSQRMSEEENEALTHCLANSLSLLVEFKKNSPFIKR